MRAEKKNMFRALPPIPRAFRRYRNPICFANKFYTRFIALS